MKYPEKVDNYNFKCRGVTAPLYVVRCTYLLFIYTPVPTLEMVNGATLTDCMKLKD